MLGLLTILLSIRYFSFDYFSVVVTCCSILVSFCAQVNYLLDLCRMGIIVGDGDGLAV